MTDWIDVIVITALTLAAATTGGIFKPGPFYDSLEKPSWTPPDWAFPVVWSILYVMIAIAGWMVWEVRGFSMVMGVWAAQLVLNALWSYLAFGQRRFDWAFYEVVLLWLSVALFIVLAWPASPMAALLFLPYLVWVSLAAVLNYSVWSLNPKRAAGVLSQDV